MKKSKIMSLLLALTMIMSCFSGVAQAEETVDVTITQNDVALDGLEGMPLSFHQQLHLQRLWQMVLTFLELL